MPTPTEPVRPGFLRRHRTLIMLLALLLFLPPLALIFQATTGDNDFCGKWCPRMFFTWRQGTSGSEFLFGFVRSLPGVLLVLSILGTTLLFGRWWCSHFCPVGGATELGSRLVPERLKISYAAIPAAPIRYGYFAVYLLAPALGIGSLCCNYCNFAAVPRLFGAAFTSADLAYFLRSAGLINLGLLLLLGFFARGGRAYCNFLCPVGALDALANRIGLRRGRRYRVDHARCTGCGHCRAVCPTCAIEVDSEAASPARIEQLNCMPCGACANICEEGAIRYGKQT